MPVTVNPPNHVKESIAQALADGQSATKAYMSARPNCVPATARVAGPIVAKMPEVVAMRDAILARSASVGVLSREEIQRMLSLAAVTPKDADSLSKPENAWLLTKDKTVTTEHGETRELQSISTIDALRELSKVSGNYAPQVVQVQHSGAVKTLAESDEYFEMLEQERLLASAQRGRIREVEAVPDGQESGSAGAETAMGEVDADALSLDWMDESD